MSASLDGIDKQLALMSTALKANSDALATNADSLGTLAGSTQALATRLGSGTVEDSLGDVQLVIVVVLLVFTSLSLVPAIGALVFGVWLRRELERSSCPAARERAAASRTCRGPRRRVASTTSTGTARRRRDTGRAPATAGR